MITIYHFLVFGFYPFLHSTANLTFLGVMQRFPMNAPLVIVRDKTSTIKVDFNSFHIKKFLQNHSTVEWYFIGSAMEKHSAAESILQNCSASFCIAKPVLQNCSAWFCTTEPILQNGFCTADLTNSTEPILQNCSASVLLTWVSSGLLASPAVTPTCYCFLLHPNQRNLYIYIEREDEDWP
ncbi:uncharacterized protein G2W53_004125 [Senna tora]|uniref:Uncharacterized protein n=1 Tax=Senna tora TaxID=362788 RepID=A0A834XBS7_9FABA|nr:uncharacterized protein G2W53_004125 [Senna tora]